MFAQFRLAQSHRHVVAEGNELDQALVEHRDDVGWFAIPAVGDKEVSKAPLTLLVGESVSAVAAGEGDDAIGEVGEVP